MERVKQIIRKQLKRHGEKAFHQVVRALKEYDQALSIKALGAGNRHYR